MPDTPITNKANPFAKKVRLVASQARSAPAELVLAEGVRVLEEAIAARHEIEGAMISEGFGRGPKEKALIERLRAEGIRLYRAGDALMRNLSGVVAPQGVLGLVRVPILSLDAVSPDGNPLILCACGIQDPGNLGTLIRTAAAAGARMVCTISGTVSARNPKSVRSSAGVFFCIPVIEDLRPEDFLEFCRSRSVRAFRADARARAAYDSLDLTQATAILLGGESRGLTGQEWTALPAIRIPMSPGVESLNVAAAGAILLFEAYRQRSAPRRPSRNQMV
jgi:TrmH family RNA methyltransferase